MFGIKVAMGLRCALTALALTTVLASCSGFPFGGDPMQDVEMLSDVDLADMPEQAQLVASNDAPALDFGALFAGLLGSGTDEAEASSDQKAALKPPSLLARLTGTAQDDDEADVPPMTEQVFGALSRTCGVSGASLGEEITRTAGFRIFDTNPGTTAPRTHYITGFDDRCARQFTAALVMTGDVGTHELVRYSKTRVTLDYSQTDNAYEAIKSNVCRVSHGTPCGDRLEKLGRSTTFVTAYKTFGAGPVWAEFLLHEGSVAAVDLEGE